MKVLDFTHIKEINKQGIIYIDRTGKDNFIDFKLCRENWVNYVNTSKQFITWDEKPFINITTEETTCVGQRDWFAEQPYIEFFTEPKLRFVLQTRKHFWDILNKNWKHRYYNDFARVHLTINEKGWSTFDLG